MPRSRFLKLYFFHGALQLVSLFICVIMFYKEINFFVFFQGARGAARPAAVGGIRRRLRPGDQEERDEGRYSPGGGVVRKSQLDNYRIDTFCKYIFYIQVIDRLLAGTGRGAAGEGMEEDRDLERIFVGIRGKATFIDGNTVASRNACGSLIIYCLGKMRCFVPFVAHTLENDTFFRNVTKTRNAKSEEQTRQCYPEINYSTKKVACS